MSKNIFKRVMSLLLSVTLMIGAVPFLEGENGFNPFVLESEAATYGDLTYEVVDGAITITDCDTSATVVDIPAQIGGVPVTWIGPFTFLGCEKLTSIAIPDSVMYIENFSFSDCIRLTSITVDPNNEFYSDINGVLFYNNTITEVDGEFHRTITDLIRYPAGKQQAEYTVPNGVTSIRAEAFVNCSNLISIRIPDNLTIVNSSTFAGCTNLTSITIPNTVTSIDHSAFFGCKNLTSITIPNSVTSIGYDAFSNCTSLTSITIPNSVTSIGKLAFE